MLTLVRHAHAGEKKNWRRPDTERPLSQRGWQQARGLAQTLSGVPESRLVSSPFLRCHQTLVPLASLLGRPIQHHGHLAPGTDPAELARVLDDAQFDGAVVCTHGETIVSLLKVWASRLVLEDAAGRSAVDLGSTEKGAAWIIVPDGSSMHAHYLRPLLIGEELESEAWAQASG